MPEISKSKDPLTPGDSNLSTDKSSSCENVCPTLNNIFTIAQRSLGIFSECVKTAAYHTALTLGKVVAVTLLSSVLVVAIALTALSAITLIGRSYTLKENEEPRLFHYMASICLDFKDIIGITFNYQIPCNNEILQSADDKENSPEFIVIHPPSVSSENSLPPIVYALGYLDEPETLRTTCRELAQRTGSAVYIVKYRSRFQSIDEHAKDFNRVAERALADVGKSELFLAGHSMGGLVTGTYIAEHKKAEVTIKKWFTVASPLKGTPIAYLGWGKCAEQMRPSSTFIRAFNEEDKQKLLESVPSLHVYTKTDLVVPYSSARKMQQNAQESMSSQPYGHLSVRSCPEIMQEMEKALRA